MNRNVESHFSEIPYIDKPRSIFDRSFTHKFSGNVSELIPFYIESVLPGDTFRVTTSKVIRFQTLLTPIMDNLYADFYYFFVPWRLVWDHVREFFGENTSSAWVQQTEYVMPAISSPNGGFDVGTIADYLGLPPGVSWSNQDRNAPTALPFRAYAKICDEFFRDQNLSDPLNIPTGDSDQTGSNGSSYINDVANGGKPFKVAKFHDYFTSCLPNVQKANSPVSLPLTTGSLAPVSAYKDAHDPQFWLNPVTEQIHVYPMAGYYAPFDTYNNTIARNSNASLVSLQNNASSQKEVIPTTGTTSGFSQAESAAQFSPTNLWADLQNAVNSTVTVNELRLAFQLQRYYEQLARSGSRYIEFIRSMYGVTSPDARLQRPEYLGGNRVPITINEVINQAQTQSDYLGDVGAQSSTGDIHEDFEKSFTEFGYCIGLMCIRFDHSYPQGLERFWTRRTLFDQYMPTFAHLGEQPVYSYEIYANGNMDNDDVFGYNEAWADYRFKPDRVSGEMRPGIANTLASWHLSDYYQQTPTLSDGWIREDANIVDRVLAVGSNVSNQFWCDVYVKNLVTRVMPMYSVPGLIDHF